VQMDPRESVVQIISPYVGGRARCGRGLGKWLKAINPLAVYYCSSAPLAQATTTKTTLRADSDGLALGL